MYVELVESYIYKRMFRIKQKDEYPKLKNIIAGVPQGTALDSMLYVLYMCDLTQNENVTTDTFADDTA